MLEVAAEQLARAARKRVAEEPTPPNQSTKTTRLSIKSDASVLGSMAVEDDRGKNRYMVRMHDGQERVLKPGSIRELAALGSKVQLHGLQGTGLNGVLGTCEEWDDGKTRCMVRLVGGEVKSVKQENLKVLDMVAEQPTALEVANLHASLVVASKVCLQGLRASPQLNDAQGTCEKYDTDKNRYMVRMYDGQVKAFKPENIRVLAVLGSKVQLHGLQGAPELNGVLGACEEWDDGKTRWMVRLESGEVRSVKPENLTVVAERPNLASRKYIKLEKLREIFDRCDLNKDEQVNKREVIRSCKTYADIAQFFHLPRTIQQESEGRLMLEMLFQEIDKNGDREISWPEFQGYFRNMVVEYV